MQERTGGAPLEVKGSPPHVDPNNLYPSSLSHPHCLALGQGPELLNKVLTAASSTSQIPCALGQGGGAEQGRGSLPLGQETGLVDQCMVVAALEHGQIWASGRNHRLGRWPHGTQRKG